MDVEVFRNELDQTTKQMRELATFIREHVLPVASVPNKFGRAGNRQELLQMFREATKNSIEFVVSHDIATVPANRTIIVELLPEHSPLARIRALFHNPYHNEGIMRDTSEFTYSPAE